MAKITLWIAEDEAAISDYIATYLRDRGYAVKEFKTCDEVWSAFQTITDPTQKPAAILADFSTEGELNGVRLIEHIRTLDKNIPLLLQTGKVPDEIKKTMDALVSTQNVALIMKPFEMPVLLATLMEKFPALRNSLVPKNTVSATEHANRLDGFRDWLRSRGRS